MDGDSSTGGAVSNLGHAVQYFFDWGDGTNSGWLPVGTTSASKIWTTAGTYPVQAQARCATTTTVVSSYSTSLSVAISAATTGPTALTTPTPGATFGSASVAFTWTAGAGATSYGLFVGSAAGGSDLYSSGILGDVLTQTVSGLPTDGRGLYVRLWSLVNGTWGYVDYSYTAFTSTTSTKALMVTPANGATLASSATFTWRAGTSATNYGLFVGSTPGAADLYSSGLLANTVLSQTVSGIPTDGRTLYVRLWSLVAGNWVFTDYTYK